MVSRSVQVRSRFSPDTNQFGQIRADSRGMVAQSMLLMLQGRVGGRAKAGAEGGARARPNGYLPQAGRTRLGREGAGVAQITCNLKASRALKGDRDFLGLERHPSMNERVDQVVSFFVLLLCMHA